MNKEQDEANKKIEEGFKRIAKEIVGHNSAQELIFDGLNELNAIIKGYEDSTSWISVEDRLPEKEGSFLVISKRYGTVVRPYNKYYKCWDTEDGDDYYCNESGGDITDWMPLPTKVLN